MIKKYYHLFVTTYTRLALNFRISSKSRNNILKLCKKVVKDNKAIVIILYEEKTFRRKKALNV